MCSPCVPAEARRQIFIFGREICQELWREFCGICFKNLLMPLFLMGCFPVDFQEVKRPLRTKSGKRPIKVGKRPIKEGKRPIKAMVLVGISVCCLMGRFRAPPPWRKTAPLKRPIKRSMIVQSHKIKAPTFRGKFRNIFCETIRASKKIFRANFVLQTCHSKFLASRLFRVVGTLGSGFLLFSGLVNRECCKPDPPILAFFGKKKARTPEKSKDFPLCRTPRILGKGGENAQKARKIAKRKKQGNRKKQGLEGQIFRKGLFRKGVARFFGHV